MIVEIPRKKGKESGWKRWRTNVIIQLDGKARSSLLNYEFKLGEDVYYPYWVGKIYTRHKRPFVAPKEINFYAICDSVSGDYVVLRSTGKTRLVDIDERRILPPVVKQKKVEKEIMTEAIEDRVNRQFIYGKPYVEKQGVTLLYLPYKEVYVRRKTGGEMKKFYINKYTGEVKNS